MKKNWKIETKAVQAGYEPKNAEPRILPIVQSTTFKYDTAEDVAKLFDLEAFTPMYTRINNPTVDAFAEKVNVMEGGVGAMCTSSGQAANMLAMLNICKSGDHIISASSVYGGTFNLFSKTLKNMGIETTFINQNESIEELKKYFKKNTKALFGESLANPELTVLDFDKFSKLAKEMDVPFIVDNTFPTPYLCRPLELGANIVIHSSTKYLDGHATSVGGVIVDGGNYNWKNGKFLELTDPEPTYHGLSYVDTFKEAAFIVKARVHLLRDTGACMSPMNAFLSNVGAETLHLRMERHCENALKLAKYLLNHEDVSWVNYPGLTDNKENKRANKYLPKGSSGVLSFGIKGGKEAGNKFINSLELAKIVVHVGDIRTCVLHPASMTHRQLNEEQQKACGVLPDLIRVSVGIENIDDIIIDFENALNKK